MADETVHRLRQATIAAGAVRDRAFMHPVKGAGYRAQGARRI
ncbi:hypothetical protein ABZ721_30580 [Streptomyces sp. NPDC006733]